MTLDEVYEHAMLGERLTAPHMQPGCYVEHVMARGYMRCWPVATPNLEPTRTQCDFVVHQADKDAEWRVLTSAEQYPPRDPWGKSPTNAEIMAVWQQPEPEPDEVKPRRSAWGRTSDSAARIAIDQQRAKAADAPAVNPTWGGAPAPKRDSWGRPIS